MGTRRYKVYGALAFAVTWGSAGLARADGSQAAAQALFDEGRKLMGEGKYGEACPKFADSEKLDPAPGTLLNLAKCYDKNGQTASAWVTYRDAEAISKKTGHQDWVGMAHDRAAALAPKLVRLTVNVPPTSEIEGLQLARDGVALAKSEWNTAIPVDPGPHTIEATAPNTRKWTTSVTVDPGAGSSVVTIPQLEVERIAPVPAPTPPPAPAPPPAPPPPPPSGSGMRVTGFIVGGVGIAGIAVGSAFGLLAKSKNSDALEPQNCRTSMFCTQNGLNLTSQAKTDATLSTVFFIAGGVATAAGVVLVIVAPSSKSSSSAALRLAPSVGPGGVGGVLQGAW
jgi:hypothetical protein